MAVIYVERDSQKGIIIGKGGDKIKKVGIAARHDIEKFFGKKVFLELFDYLRDEKTSRLVGERVLAEEWRRYRK